MGMIVCYRNSCCVLRSNGQHKKFVPEIYQREKTS